MQNRRTEFRFASPTRAIKRGKKSSRPWRAVAVSVVGPLGRCTSLSLHLTPSTFLSIAGVRNGLPRTYASMYHHICTILLDVAARFPLGYVTAAKRPGRQGTQDLVPDVAVPSHGNSFGGRLSFDRRPDSFHTLSLPIPDPAVTSRRDHHHAFLRQQRRRLVRDAQPWLHLHGADGPRMT